MTSNQEFLFPNYSFFLKKKTRKKLELSGRELFWIMFFRIFRNFSAAVLAGVSAGVKCNSKKVIFLPVKTTLKKAKKRHEVELNDKFIWSYW